MELFAVKSIVPWTIEPPPFDGALRVPKGTQTRLGYHSISTPPAERALPRIDPSPTVVSPPLDPGILAIQPGPQIFLDICSGPNAPLSAALERLGRAALAIEL